MSTENKNTQQNVQVKKLTDKFLELRSSVLKKGVTDKQLRAVLDTGSCQKRYQRIASGSSFCNRVWDFSTNPTHFAHAVVLLSAVSVGMLVASYELLNDYIRNMPCLVDMNFLAEEIVRPKMDCEVCRGLYSVPVEKNISPQRFYEKYAYSGTPVVIKDASVNWTAMSTFSFKYFKLLYVESAGSLESVEDNCQFFPYQTEFQNLKQALSMSEERASFQPGEKPWYFGWSNCHDGVREKLRSHYQRPYFLPADSQAEKTDWLFMGGSGPGAGMHVDFVDRPSWQAQISGRKTWRLVPSPECHRICPQTNVTVEKGDIIVVDTNMWYHSTFIHPGEISITIGSEYD